MDSLLSPSLIITVIVIALVIILLCMGYVKAPPDMAYIISGIKKKSKIVIGKASIRIPFFERLDKLNLRLIPIDVKTSNAVPTADYININVDATVNVKISNDPEKLRLAAENFLNKPTEYIAGVAREVLEGNVREIVGKMKLEEMVSDRQKFATLVKENAEPDLAAMGLDIISFNVQNFVDGNDVIENLGIDNIVKIKKAAAIARAESERDIKVAQAAADKDSNDAAVAAQTEIAKKQNELAIKKSELQMEADTKKAMADAAYEIQKEEQRRTIEITTANANIARQDREIELKQKEVAVKEQALEAEVKKQAEADRYAAQQRADAALYQRQKEAEAKQFEAQRQAEARKAQAEADRVYVTDKTDMPYIYTLFYTQTDPNVYRSTVRYRTSHVDFEEVASFDRYVFGLPETIDPEENAVYVLYQPELEKFPEDEFEMTEWGDFALAVPRARGEK